MAKLTAISTGGAPPKRLRRFGKMAIALLTVGGLFSQLYNFIHLRTVTRTAFSELNSLVSANSQLTRDVQELTRRISVRETRAATAESDRARSAALTHGKSIKTMTQEFRTLASDVLEFQDNRLGNRPTLVFGGPSDVTRKTMEDSNHYNQQAVVDFLKRFGGPIESVTRRVRPYGLDSTRLQRHVTDLNSIQMMRLIADDVNDLADQLSHGNLVSSNARRMSYCPSYYFDCPQSQR
jgi:hypothetical protein